MYYVMKLLTTVRTVKNLELFHFLADKIKNNKKFAPRKREKSVWVQVKTVVSQDIPARKRHSLREVVYL